MQPDSIYINEKGLSSLLNASKNKNSKNLLEWIQTNLLLDFNKFQAIKKVIDI